MKKLKELSGPIFNAKYRGIPIKSDIRVHTAVMDVIKREIPEPSSISILDVASGKGALAQRLVDSFPGVVIDCNDWESGLLNNGYRKIFTVDLNFDFNFETKYDLVLAIEVIEHLENPFHFIRMLKSHLKPGGFILLTTPNIDSFFDRLWFLRNGYSYYFGSRGIINSEGHITMCPEWLLTHIAEKLNLDYSIASNDVNTMGLVGLKSRFLLTLFYPLRFFLKNINDRSVTVCLIRSKV